MDDVKRINKHKVRNFIAMPMLLMMVATVVVEAITTFPHVMLIGSGIIIVYGFTMMLLTSEP